MLLISRGGVFIKFLAGRFFEICAYCSARRRKKARDLDLLEMVEEAIIRFLEKQIKLPSLLGEKGRG
jgi:hypothetical protein